MKRVAGRMLLAGLLIFNASVMHAADTTANTLPVIETQVVTVHAVPADGVLISIPRAALTVRNGVPGVFVVEKNQARFRMVRPGKTGATQVDILSGLFGGEVLVVDRLEAMRDGSPIVVSTKQSPDKK